jgi:hypothetical protein
MSLCTKYIPRTHVCMPPPNRRGRDASSTSRWRPAYMPPYTAYMYVVYVKVAALCTAVYQIYAPTYMSGHIPCVPLYTAHRPPYMSSTSGWRPGCRCMLHIYLHVCRGIYVGAYTRGIYLVYRRYTAYRTYAAILVCTGRPCMPLRTACTAYPYVPRCPYGVKVATYPYMPRCSYGPCTPRAHIYVWRQGGDPGGPCVPRAHICRVPHMYRDPRMYGATLYTAYTAHPYSSCEVYLTLERCAHRTPKPFTVSVVWACVSGVWACVFRR